MMSAYPAALAGRRFFLALFYTISLMRHICVIGAGTMGNGIAHTFARFGFTVSMVDNNGDNLKRALTVIERNLDRQTKKGLITETEKKEVFLRITSHTDLSEGVSHADLVVEAVTENPEIKQSIFRELDRLCHERVILASNTSSISITQLAASTKRADKVIGMHFMNPVPVMKLVEVIRAYDTSEETVRQITELAIQLEKEPVVVNDYPGFVSNRILMPMINEAIYTLYEGVADAKAIDSIMKLGMAHPMGPLELADFIGLDVCLSILRVLFDGFGNPKYAPCPLLINMVTAGKLGKKTGEGFYRY